MVDIIIVAIILVVVGTAVIYIRRAKKTGVKCIGCPSGGNCSSQNHSKGGTCSCGCSDTK